MKRTIAMLLCVLMLASLFVGCSKQEAPATDTQTTTDTQTAATGTEAGRTDFVFGLTSEPAQLTPYKTDEFTAFTVNYQVFNRLIELNAKGELVPSLAESWTLSEDGTQLTFKAPRGCEVPQRRRDDGRGCCLHL